MVLEFHVNECKQIHESGYLRPIAYFKCCLASWTFWALNKGQKFAEDILKLISWQKYTDQFWLNAKQADLLS